MNSVAPPDSLDPAHPVLAPRAVSRGSVWVWLALCVGVGAAFLSVSLWIKLGHIQEQLARQSTDNAAQSLEARTLARQAQELAHDAVSRVSLTEARVTEMVQQRRQLEELMQSLSRSRDENLVVDLEATLSLAQQQSQLTGSVLPLLEALRTAEQRLLKAAQPGLNPVLRAVQRDAQTLKNASAVDVPTLVMRLDEVARWVDELPTLNASHVEGHGASSRSLAAQTERERGTGHTGSATPSTSTLSADWRQWLKERGAGVWSEVSSLVRVSRIDHPEAALLAPEQSFFLKENLKLKLLNARLALLARQLEASRSDVAACTALLNKYFDPTSRRTQSVATALQDIQMQLKGVELPRLNETLTALSTVVPGR